MALEALLPSEVARLIYGYLIQEKCTETAKTFLNESPNLQECRNVLYSGKHFTTRVCGYALLDILEKFCIINSIVQEKIDKFDNTGKLRYSNDLINQIKFLVEEYRDQRFIIGINTALQNQYLIRHESPEKSYKKHSSFNKDEDKLKQTEDISNRGFKTRIQTNFNPILSCTAVETTLLKNLPGYIKDLQTEESEISKLKSPRKSKEISKFENILQNEEFNQNILKEKIKYDIHNLPSQRYNSMNKKKITSIQANFQKYNNCELQSSERWCSKREKNSISHSIEEKLRNNKSSELQTLNISSSNFELSPNNECIDILSDLILELLNRTEIQERIADNINRILEPINLNLYDKSNKETKAESNKSFMVEFNKAIKLVVNKTENDPQFLELMNEIILESQKNLNTEDKLKFDNKNKIKCKENISKNNIDKEITGLEIIGENTPYILDIQNTNKIINIEEVDLLKTKKYSINSTGIKQVDLIQEHFKIPIRDAQNSLFNNTMILLNPLELPIIQQKTVYRSNNLFSHNNVTSTPIKTCTTLQNLNTEDWFSSNDLFKPNIMYLKKNIDKPSNTNTYTACETIMTTMESNLSPIISKKTTEAAEGITSISYLSTNVIKDETFQTPDISSTKIKVSSKIPSTFPINVKSKYGTPFIQKNSEVIDELLHLQTSRKSNGNIDNLSSLLKDNEYNRYFSIESIMLYGMDNNISTVKTPIFVPEIEVEDLITLISTSLSPFITIQKKSDVNTKIIENNDNELQKVLINKTSDNSEAIIEKNDKKLITNISEVITKSTPKKLIENCKNNLSSLLTPKKPSNYVRALNFNTPTCKSYSENKLKNKQNFSIETIKKNLKNSCKLSLFQSLPFTNLEIIEQKQHCDTLQQVVLDTTNATFLNEENYKLNKVVKNKKKNCNKISKENFFLKRNNGTERIGTNKEDIRNEIYNNNLKKYLDEYKSQNKNESQKQNHKKKIRREKEEKNLEQKVEFKHSDNKKEIKVEKTIIETEFSKDTDMKTTKNDFDILLSNSIDNKEIINEEIVLKLASEDINNLTKTYVKKNNVNDKKIQQNKKPEITIFETFAKNLLNEPVPYEDLKSKELNKKIKENSSEKKSIIDYEKIEEQLSIITNTNIKSNGTKKMEVIYDQVSKVECGKIVQKKYARLKTLDTNITKSSFAPDKKQSSLSNFMLELETSQQDENTIQIPPTPQMLSPSSSSLILPISKLSEDSRTIQSLVVTPLECPLTPRIILTPPKSLKNLAEDSERSKNSCYCQSTINTFEISKKSEITQFEVIKENLLKNKINFESDPKKIVNGTRKLNPSMYRQKEVSSKSNYSSSSSASSYTCNSCLLSSSSDNDDGILDTADKNMHKNNDEDILIKIKKEKNVEQSVKVSSAKFFPIYKSDKEIKECSREFPAKNDMICTEIKIFESPNIRKLKKEDETKKFKNSKMKVISIEHVLPKVVTKSPIKLHKTSPLNIKMKITEMKKKDKNKYIQEKNISAKTKIMKINKSEEEVIKAIESIMPKDFKNISNIEMDEISESIMLDLSECNNRNDNNKIELVKAIESIIRTDYEKYALLETRNSNDETDSKANLELILEDENNRAKQKFIKNSNAHQHNTRFKSRQTLTDEKKVFLRESNDLSNCNISCQEIRYIFDENNYKRKRRKTFSDAELTWEFHDEFGGLMNATSPTTLDIIFKVNPARKKPYKKLKHGKMDQFQHFEDITQNSLSHYSDDDISVYNPKSIINEEKEVNGIINKRKRTNGQFENICINKKRKKNMFILQKL